MKGFLANINKQLVRTGLLGISIIAATISGPAASALLGNTLNLPLISYDNQGTTSYDAGSDLFSVNARPLGLLVPANPPAVIAGADSFVINIVVDAAGVLTGGVPGDDLVVTGDVTVPGLGFVSGTLLTAEVTGFGHQDSGGTTDSFDFTFTVTGGLLAPIYPVNAIIGVTLGSEQSNFTGDFTVDFGGEAKGTLGVLELPPAEIGELVVTKSCAIQEPVSSDWSCTKPIDTLTMIWNGPQDPGETVTVKAYKGNTGDELLDTVSGIEVGDEVSVSGFAGSPNDVVWEVFDASGNKLGESKFHLSCSDEAMNGAEDCGMPEGDGKGDDSALLNDWLLEGIIDAGGELNCTADAPADPDLVTECEIASSEGTECTKRPTEISIRYHAGDSCADSDNIQAADKTSCTDFGATTEPVQIIFSKDDGNNISLDTGPGATVQDGDVVTATAANAGRSDFDSSSRIHILDGSGGLLQEIELHTSCSQPLLIGDRYGAVEIVGYTNEEQGTVQSGAEVKYTYTVTNNCNVDLTGITVEDDELNPTTVPGSPVDLLDTESTMLMTTVFVGETVTGTVTASATGPNGEICEGSASTTVTIVPPPPPPPCVVTPDEFKLEDDKIKWKLTNGGDDVATVESIEFSAADEFGFVKKVKLDGDIFKDSTRPMTWTFTEADFLDDLSNRQIKVGDTKELTFETTEKFEGTTADEVSITVHFVEGCSVTFEPGAQPFVCSDAKPIDSLSMIWAGPEPVDVTSPTGAVVAGVVAGQEVTFSGLSGLGNDVYWQLSGAVNGESGFHMSCSDSAMNGPEDCGSPQGDNKGNDDGLNLWLFEGMAGTNGLSLDCTP